jgi:outer membrane protein TolC
MNLHQRDAQKLMDEGVLSYAEFLHAKVYASEADRELKKAERQIEIAQQALKNSISVNEYSRIIPISNLFYSENIPSLEYFTSKMPTESDLLKKVEYKKQLVDTKYKAQRGDFMPTIAAMGTYDIVNHDLSPYMPEYLLGIGMKWNLFEGAARSRKVQAVQMQQKQVEHVFEKTQSDLLVAVKKFYQEMQMYREQLTELETATTFAEEYYRVRKKAFSEGMATAAELSDANLALAKVRIERLQAMYQFDVALSKTLYYSGLTDELSSYQNN